MVSLAVFLVGLLALGIGIAIFAVKADRDIEAKKRPH